MQADLSHTSAHADPRKYVCPFLIPIIRVKAPKKIKETITYSLPLIAYKLTTKKGFGSSLSTHGKKLGILNHTRVANCLL